MPHSLTPVPQDITNAVDDYALLPLLADERYAAAHPLLATLHTDEAEVDE